MGVYYVSCTHPQVAIAYSRLVLPLKLPRFTGASEQGITAHQRRYPRRPQVSSNHVMVNQLQTVQKGAGSPQELI